MSSKPVSWWEWGLFGVIVLVMIATDLWVHRRARPESKKAAFAWSGLWILVGLAFSGFVGWRHGGGAANEYLGAYLIEKSLSLDNLFVFLVIFSGLQVPEEQQRRVLFWGIFGALLFRALFIILGLEAMEHWHWVTYVFGGVLLLAAFRVARDDPSQEHEQSGVVRWLERHLPVTTRLEGSRFLLRVDGRRQATPLLLALLAIELSDVAFAVDSVPAALSISRNLFVVYSSNIFAILGLRALYIALAKTVHDLRYLHWGLAAVLAFAAAKMLLAEWITLSPLLSVAILLGCIGLSVVASLPGRHRETHGPPRPLAHRPSRRSPAR